MLNPATAVDTESAAPPPFARVDVLRESFDSAAQAAGGVVDQWFTIAGRAVCLRGAGPQVIERLTRTMTHLRREPGGEPELIVHLWDSETGASVPPHVPVVEGQQAPGAFFYFSDDDVRAGFQLGTSGDARVLAVYPDMPPPQLSVLRPEAGEAFYWIADAAGIPYWEEATPLKYIMDWWLRHHGMYQLHAGAVGAEAGGVLLVGKSGSGKSTSSLSALQSDLRYAGDDYVAVEPGEAPHVHSLYTSGKVMPDHVQRLPFLLPALANSDQLDVEKAVLYAHEHWPENVTTGFPLRALLAPKVTPGLVESRVVPISRVEGLAALAPSTVFQLHTRAQDTLSGTARLLEQVPCYRLELGSDIPSIPRAIGQLLEELSAREPAA